MTLQVFTSRISYRGADRFDVTRKSGGDFGRIFAPTWYTLRPALNARRQADRLRKAGRVDEVHAIEERAWATYVPSFEGEMDASIELYPRAWADLLARARVVLVCYCPKRERCHRGLLVPMLVARGAVDGGEIEAAAQARLPWMGK